ncbi:hypothetical protein EB354_07570 [Chryseobacterium balustinum]|uniref:Uncharacterized protein n=1 Tax=Chryseobacterium balustinum TaxID=246 RepID=A0AAX2IRB7_9FLAO|nr:hypothetical protein EB354_07570 [Chryseobacterium balustinum]SKB68093.1 hypothetical protein SAMN05421800_1062 [Chryseobacterium balustinum]SQA91618.1 Uncharacterised protein [Chryseobacterium balustinum]
MVKYREKEVYEYDRAAGKYKLNVESKINDIELLNFYNNSNSGFANYLELKFDYFINKIELIDNFKFD